MNCKYKNSTILYFDEIILIINKINEYVLSKKNNDPTSNKGPKTENPKIFKYQL